MKVILDGKSVGKGYSGYYLTNRAFFTKRGLTKRIILHELYHHLIDSKGLEMPVRKEEKEANMYAKVPSKPIFLSSLTQRNGYFAFPLLLTFLGH
jgi:hypothetical protein